MTPPEAPDENDIPLEAMDSHRSSRAYRSGSVSGEYASYRRGSNVSDASFMADINMADDEMFSGPVSESVPDSTVGFFSRRRSRSDSVTSFTYYDEDQDSAESWTEENETLEDGEESTHEDLNGAAAEYASPNADVEAAGRRPPQRRTSSGYSRSSKGSRRSHDSAADPLLVRQRSSDSATSGFSGIAFGKRTNQKIYIASEDLTIVLAGFRTSLIGYALYLTFCICTVGIGYLLFRWLPRWRIKLVGSASPLKDCQWVVIEVMLRYFEICIYVSYLLMFRRINGAKYPFSRSNNINTD